MQEQLELIIGEIGDINSKLVMLVDLGPSGKTNLLNKVGSKFTIMSFNFGME